jgi:hypothetical protein
LREALRKLADNTSIGCGWRAAEHYQAARRWSSVHRWLSLPAAVIAGAAGTAIIANTSDQTLVLIAGLAGLLVAGLTAASGVLTPDERANQHKKAYDGFSALLTRFRVFRDATLRSQRSDEELTQTLTKLLDQRDELAAVAPEPPLWAQRKVVRARRKSHTRSTADDAPDQ